MREMGEYMRKCEVTEVGHDGARRRAMEVTSSDSSKRRKIVDSRELLQSSSSNVQLVNQHRCLVNLPGHSVSPHAPGPSDYVPAPLCSSNESTEFVKDGLRSLDLKAEGFETEISTSIDGGFSRETTSTRELCTHSDGMESSTTNKPSPASSRLKPSAAKMPSTAEIEEFFSVAQKYEQKRFADKYNYDIVKDVPLEGRYQWVRLKP